MTEDEMVGWHHRLDGHGFDWTPADGDYNHELKDAWKKSCEQRRQHIKKQRHYFTNKGLSSQGYGFSSSHEWMCKLDHKEGRALKN